jgi:4-hydroxybenzoate polyprenyltransferase/phosphoserine phosphatase
MASGRILRFLSDRKGLSWAEICGERERELVTPEYTEVVSGSSGRDSIPICIDCDGTLIASDLFHEALVKLLLRMPWMLPAALIWWMQGRHVLKSKVALLSPLEVASLPFRHEVVAYAHVKKAAGAKLYLATAATKEHAEQVARHLDIFDGLFHSDETTNMKGPTKAEVLVERFGRGGFNYVGDSRADLPVWRTANKAIVAGNSTSFFAKVKTINPNAKHIPARQSQRKVWPKLIRVHQWAKNLIIFVPLVTAHQLFNPDHFLSAVDAFLSLSFIASATYILNDLLDLDHDRAHKTKRRRPLASGAISMPTALGVGFLFLAAGVGVAALLPPLFWRCLILYVLLTTAYSFYFKKIAIADAIVLASLYTLRLLIGHAATGLKLSFWLLAFSIFLFFSLALVKRYVEIADLASEGAADASVQGRGYKVGDLWIIGALGVACGVVSVLVLILYVSSPDVSVLYAYPTLLLLLAPLFLYWVGHIWLLASRGRVHEDPVVFALRDKTSYVVALLTFAIIAVAAGGK